MCDLSGTKKIAKKSRNKFMKIKDLPKVDRPREKLEKYGPTRLSDSELLAILLGSGIKGKNVLTLSREILRQAEEMGLANISRDDLKKIGWDM